MCKPHREEKYFYFLNVICACECVSRSSENTQRSRCSQSQVHTIISQVPVSHQVYDHLGAQPLVFRQPQAITSVHRLRHVTMVHAGSGKKKPQGMLTGSLTLTRKIPRGKLITFLKLLKPRRPEGPQHITLDSKRPVTSWSRLDGELMGPARQIANCLRPQGCGRGDIRGPSCGRPLAAVLGETQDGVR